MRNYSIKSYIQHSQSTCMSIGGHALNKRQIQNAWERLRLFINILRGKFWSLFSAVYQHVFKISSIMCSFPYWYFRNSFNRTDRIVTWSLIFRNFQKFVMKKLLVGKFCEECIQIRVANINLQIFYLLVLSC